MNPSQDSRRGRSEPERQQSSAPPHGHSGEGAASAMEQWISQNQEQWNIPKPQADESRGAPTQ